MANRGVKVSKNEDILEGVITVARTIMTSKQNGCFVPLSPRVP